VANLRANFRLGKLLQKFKEYSTNRNLSAAMIEMCDCVENGKASKYEGELTDKLFNDFEELFVGGDGAALDLKKVYLLFRISYSLYVKHFFRSTDKLLHISRLFLSLPTFIYNCKYK
jgi:hypothetical protein